MSVATDPPATTEDNRLAIVGQVTHADGSPFDRAALTLTDLQGHQVDRGTTGVDGGYRLLPPAGGSYIVICVAGEHQPRAALVSVTERSVRHDVKLSGAGSIAGAVRLGGSGRGILGVTVTLTDLRGNVVSASTTGESGAYAFGDLTEGTYTLTAASVDYQPVAATVAVPAGARVDKDVELAGRCRLAGTVRSATSGRPIGEALVTLIDATGTVVGAAPTGPDGAYAFDDLPEGAYTLTAAGYAPTATGIQLSPGAADNTDITLTAPQAHG